MKQASLILPMYKTNPELTKRQVNALKKQSQKINLDIVVVDKGIDAKSLSLLNSLKSKGRKLRIFKVDSGISFASSMNAGIKKATCSLVIILQQDCIPKDDKWLSRLIEPFNDEKVIASVSKVELPFELWNRFDFIAKILSVKELGVITPALDEKACAYKKEILAKAGLFDYKNFRTAGEDFDMYLKIRNLGKIAYPDTGIIHYHFTNWKKRLEKELQLSNGFGALVRIYKTGIPRWHVGLLKSIPIVGFPIFLLSIKSRKIKLLSLAAVPLCLAVNLIYSYGFWKGLLNKKQTV